MSRAFVPPPRLYVRAVVLAGALVCAHAAWDMLRRPLPLEWLVLLALTAGTGLASLRVPKMPISFSISDTFSIVAALLVGPAAGALTAALDGLVLSFRMTNDRRTPARVLFNIACLAIATWVAGEAYVALAGAEPLRDGPLGALRLLALVTVFGALHFGLNSGIVAVAVAAERKASIKAIWREHFSGLWVSSFGGTFAAMLMLVLSRRDTLELLILIAPLPVILYVALRHALGRAEDQIEHLGKMNRVYVATIEALAQAVDAKDHVTHDHVRRVQENSLRLAEALGVRDDAQLQAIKAASLLHDIGKIAIPEHILNKPGRLTAAEFEVMKRHAAIGADILAVIGFPYPLVPIVRHHHENWDGTGYPDGLAGEQIPVGARILQVIDCFDALTSDRPYRPAMSEADALAIVRQRAGTMYDPRVVDALLALHASTGLHVEAAAQPVTPSAPQRVDAPAGDAGRRLLLETMTDLGAALAAPAAASRAGEILWARLQQRLPAAAFVLFVNDNEADVLVPLYCAGERTVSPDVRITVGDRLSGWVAATRRSIVNSDARLDFDGDVRETTTLRSALAVPIVEGNDTLGVLTFYAEAPDAFDDTHQRIAEAAATLTAHALHTAAQRPVAIAV